MFRLVAALSGREITRSRCEPCRETYERNKSRRRRRTASERTRRQDLIAAHVRVHGWTWPGYGCPPHPSGELTADHVLAVARGGSEEGAIRVLCRSCNSRRGRGHESTAQGLAQQGPERSARR